MLTRSISDRVCQSASAVQLGDVTGAIKRSKDSTYARVEWASTQRGTSARARPLLLGRGNRGHSIGKFVRAAHGQRGSEREVVYAQLWRARERGIPTGWGGVWPVGGRMAGQIGRRGLAGWKAATVDVSGAPRQLSSAPSHEMSVFHGRVGWTARTAPLT